MLKNHLKVALRKIKRNKLYASLNILGLAVGLASFFIIYLFVQNELSYDRYHQNADRIYRIAKSKTQGEISTYAGISAALAKPVIDQVPEIDAYTRIEAWKKTVVFSDVQDSVQSLDNLAVDAGFYDIFDLTLLEGTVPDYEKNPNQVIVSESLAKRKWQGNAMGKTLKVRGISFLVSGVYTDFPENSSLKGELIFEIEAVNQWRKESFSSVFRSFNDELYFLLPENQEQTAVAAKVENIFNDMRGNNVEAASIALQPLSDIHFNVQIGDRFGRKTDIQMVFLFSAIAFFILLCSFFNYVSLAIAQSLERTREIGIKKVMGAVKSQIYREYLFESMVLILMAILVSIVLVESLLPSLENLIERKLDSSIKYSWKLWGYALLFIFGLTSLAALYPSIISGYSGISDLLKNSVSKFRSSRWINVVTVFQVVVFMSLISVSIAANRQLNFMQNEDLGFDKENILTIQPFGSALGDYGDIFTNEFLKIPGVLSITRARSRPGSVMGTMTISDRDDLTFYNFPIGLGYFETMRMKVLLGRPYIEDDLGKNRVILNESAIKAMGIVGNPVGHTFDAFDLQWTVIGVVEDFHFASKKEQIRPTFFRLLKENEAGSMMIRLDGNNLAGAIAALEEEYTNISGGVMPYFFLEERFDALYKDENTMITMIQSGTVMAAVIAFMGLFGISGYAVKRRMKEMGIRKVLGADFINIQTILNRANLLKLSLATFIAFPLIYYWLNAWLNSFAYRIDFPVGLIGVSLLFAIGVCMSTAFIHSIKAYFINPVEILKDE